MRRLGVPRKSRGVSCSTIKMGEKKKEFKIKAYSTKKRMHVLWDGRYELYRKRMESVVPKTWNAGEIPTCSCTIPKSDRGTDSGF